MSVWKYIFDSDMLQRYDLENMNQRVGLLDKQREAARRNYYRVSMLEQDVAELTLLCQTMMEIIVEKGLVTNDEFMARMKKIDARDGKEDGRLTKTRKHPAHPPEPKLRKRP